jgi:excisionase family DNA binding protein
MEQRNPAGKLLLQVDEVADQLSIGRSKLYTFILSGQLRSVKVGRRRLIPPEAVRDFVDWLQQDADAGAGKAW